MATTKTGNRQRSKNGPPNAPTIDFDNAPEVMTLTEAATYLRVTENAVRQLAVEQSIPGRCIDQEWRFLKSALEDWLRTPPQPGSREAVLSVAGAWKNDAELENELAAIYRRRRKPFKDYGK